MQPETDPLAEVRAALALLTEAVERLTTPPEPDRKPRAAFNGNHCVECDNLIQTAGTRKKGLNPTVKYCGSSCRSQAYLKRKRRRETGLTAPTPLSQPRVRPAG